MARAYWVYALLFGCVLMQAMAVAYARSPMVPVEDMIAVELATVGLDSASGAPVVLLREPVGGDVVLIHIGSNEALAILLGLRDIPVPRPMTHDLLVDLIESLGGRLERVMVDALEDSTYLGVLELRLEDRDEPVYIDSRPSDALALAVRTGAPILVAPAVLVSTRGQEYRELPGSDPAPVTALGITVGGITDDLREALGLPLQPGVLISRTTGEAAERGLLPGAVILEVNGEVPESPMHFLELVRDTPAQKRARLRVWQEGQVLDLELSTEVPVVPIPRPRTGTRV
jgi:bifunctional DNase/RNase